MRLSVAFQISQAKWWLLPISRSVVRVCATVALFLFSFIYLISATGEVLETSVTKEDGEYVVLIVAVIDAPEDYVYRVVTDYQHVYRINPTITRVDVQSTDRDGVVRVQHQSEHIIGPFCFHIDWGGDIVETQHENFKFLEITTIPDISSFDSGAALWTISPHGDRTWVRHESRLKPKFFIPPVIGDYFMKKHMRDEILATFNRIECHAQTMLERDMVEEPEQLTELLRKKKDCIQQHGYEAGFAVKNQ